MKTLLHPVVIACLILAGSFLYIPEEKGRVASLLDREFYVDPEIHSILTGLIETGQYSDGDILIDASPVQTVEVADGKVIFNPPVIVQWKFISTTVTEIQAGVGGSSIFVDIDNSPVDINVLPRKP